MDRLFPFENVVPIPEGLNRTFRPFPAQPVGVASLVFKSIEDFSGTAGLFHHWSDFLPPRGKLGKKRRKAQQFLLGSLQPINRFFPFPPIEVDPEQAFQEHSSLKRFLLNDFSDLSLPHEGEPNALQSPCPLDLVQVLKADAVSVDGQKTRPLLVDLSPDLACFFPGKQPNGHFRFLAGGQARAPLEKQVGLPGDPEIGRRTFTEDPSHGIEEVAFSAPVRPDDAGQPGRKRQIVVASEALKTLKQKLGDVH
jgi:hypothetical protein